MEGLIALTEPTRDQFELAASLVGYASGFRYQVRGNFLFQGIPLRGANVLEVGCGTGAWAIWAALKGADRVIGIEPEAHGSTSTSLEKFKQTIEVLKLGRKVMAADQYLHQLPLQEQPFDVVVMFNVINHLDEDAVVVLREDPLAFERYVTLLKHLHLRMHPDGWLIVADCARANFWSNIGLPSPFAPSIEWHKHQDPDVWINISKHAGFVQSDLRWSPLQPFTRWTANRFVQYLTCSHFVFVSAPAHYASETKSWPESEARSEVCRAS